MKVFFRILPFVCIFELSFYMFAQLLHQKADNYPLAEAGGNMIMFLLSLPFGLIDRYYPYSAPEAGVLVGMMVVITLLLHTLAVFTLYRATKRPAIK